MENKHHHVPSRSKFVSHIFFVVFFRGCRMCPNNTSSRVIRCSPIVFSIISADRCLLPRREISLLNINLKPVVASSAQLDQLTRHFTGFRASKTVDLQFRTAKISFIDRFRVFEIVKCSVRQAIVAANVCPFADPRGRL